MDSAIRHKGGTMVLQTFHESGLCQWIYVFWNKTAEYPAVKKRGGYE